MQRPPITVSCDCGETREVPYGEAWRCESCGRVWDTNQIPAEEYEGLLRRMKRCPPRGVRDRRGARRDPGSADRLREPGAHLRRFRPLRPSGSSSTCRSGAAGRAGSPRRRRTGSSTRSSAMLTLRRTPPIEQATHAGRRGRPVLLATIDAPFDEEAADLRSRERARVRPAADRRERPADPARPAVRGHGVRNARAERGGRRPTSARRPSLRTPSASPSSGCGFSARIRSTPCSRSSPSGRRAFSSSPPTARLVKPRSYRRAAKKIAAKAPCLVWLAE